MAAQSGFMISLMKLNRQFCDYFCSFLFIKYTEDFDAVKI